MSVVYILGFIAGCAIVHFLFFRLFFGKIFASVLIILGGVLSVVIYQLWAYVDLGYLDPFFLIATVVQFAVSFIVGWVVLLIFKYTRRNFQPGITRSESLKPAPEKLNE